MVALARPTCRNCGVRVAWYPRGLCKRCYSIPFARVKYPTRVWPCLGSRAADGVPEPTDHPIGSEGKVAELERRTSLGLMLWHAADRQTAGPETRVSFSREGESCS